VSRSQLLYLDPGGVYRRRWVDQKQEEPVSIVNRKDGQLHILRGAPIFVKAPPVKLSDISELLTVRPPRLSPLAEHRQMLVEEDNPWPVGVMADPLSADEQKKQLKDMRQEWMQKSKGVARTKSRGEMSNKMVNASIAVALGLGALIAAIAIQIMTDKEEEVVAGIMTVQRLVG